MPESLSELLTIENRYTGPMPDEERWIVRLGSRAAVERARAKAAVRFLGDACLRLVRRSRPTPELHDEVRLLLAEKAAVNRVSHIIL
jgi:hypothetical protein